MMAVHGGEAVAHAGLAGAAVLEPEDVAQLVAGGLAAGGGVGQIAGVQVQAAVPGDVGLRVVIQVAQPAWFRVERTSETFTQ